MAVHDGGQPLNIYTWGKKNVGNIQGAYMAGQGHSADAIDYGLFAAL
jgi:hypothetical protein